MKKTLLIICLIICFSALKAQKSVSSLDIENNEDYTSFTMLDSMVADYSVFFTGENHNFRTSNYKLQLKMLKYLYAKTGVTHLFLEFGVSRGWLVDNYIQSGDSSLFKILEDYSYDEYALLYKGLRDFNKTLPEDKKIHIHGIDIERSFATPIKVMSMLLPTSKAPKEILLNIETLKALGGKIDSEHGSSVDMEEEGKSIYGTGFTYNNYGDRYNTDKTLLYFLKDYDSLKNVYQTYLGDNAPIFDRIVEGVKAEYKRNEYLNDAAMQSFVYREQFMYNELLQLTKQFPNEKFYGQFGRCHTPVNPQDKWCDFYFFNTLATRINTSEEEELKGKVMSIGIYYPNSTTFEIEATSTDKLYDLFEANEKSGLKLVKVDSKDSLFEGVYDKYQFLIVNYEAFKLEETTYTDETSYDYETGFEYGMTFPNIEGHIGYIFMNLSALNPTFNSHGLAELKSPQMIYGGAITLYEDWYISGSVSLHVLPKVTNRYNDTTQLSFNGMFLKGYFGFESTMSEIFNFTPRIGIGYGKIQFKQTFDNPLNTGSSTSIFEQPISSEIRYFNNAFLLDPGFDLRFNMRYVALGLITGYQFDLSEKDWYSNPNSNISGAPKSNLSGFYAMLTLSLFYSFW